MPGTASARRNTMSDDDENSMLLQASCVAIAGRALAMVGPPGCGKSSLALALIDRGATLIGDDGVRLTRRDDRLWANPPPNISGLLEVRGVGLIELPIAAAHPLALILELGGTDTPERLPDTLPVHSHLGLAIPVLRFDPGSIVPAQRAERALALHGLS